MPAAHARPPSLPPAAVPRLRGTRERRACRAASFKSSGKTTVPDDTAFTRDLHRQGLGQRDQHRLADGVMGIVALRPLRADVGDVYHQCLRGRSQDREQRLGEEKGRLQVDSQHPVEALPKDVFEGNPLEEALVVHQDVDCRVGLP